MQAVGEAEALIQQVLAQLADPDLSGATCTPSFLLTRAKTTLDVIDTVTENFSQYNNDPSGSVRTESSVPYVCMHVHVHDEKA